jgi:hypothetical protein
MVWLPAFGGQLFYMTGFEQMECLKNMPNSTG